MRIAEVIGRVTLSRLHPSLRGGRFLIALPMPLEGLDRGLPGPRRGGRGLRQPRRRARRPDRPERGREAANPFGKNKTPVDAYCACLLDRLSLLKRARPRRMDEFSGQSEPLDDGEDPMIGNGSMMNEWKLREQMCEIGRRVYAKGFAAANDGNISYRLGEDRVLCTPTRVSKGFMKPDDLCIVDMDGKQVSGKRKRSSEILLHLTIMKARPDVRSCVHCHPPHATAFAVAHEPIPKCILPEFEVFLGEVAISPYETPGGQTFADTVLPYVKDTDTILLANHGTDHLRHRPRGRLLQDRDHRRLLPDPDPGQAARHG